LIAFSLPYGACGSALANCTLLAFTSTHAKCGAPCTVILIHRSLSIMLLSPSRQVPAAFGAFMDAAEIVSHSVV
jgi:hypothetical protein